MGFNEALNGNPSLSIVRHAKQISKDPFVTEILKKRVDITKNLPANNLPFCVLKLDEFLRHTDPETIFKI